MLTLNEEDNKPKGAVSQFFSNHAKTLMTIAMIFGTVAVIVCIVMVHKSQYEKEIAEEGRGKFE